MPAVAGSMTLAVRLPRAYKYGLQGLCFRERPYHAERTGTHSNAEVKLCRARLVLARGTSWEP